MKEMTITIKREADGLIEILVPDDDGDNKNYYRELKELIDESVKMMKMTSFRIETRLVV